MKNKGLANSIINLRIQKGYSQQRLADESKLSLRTIQRIENGESSPRGDTLNRIFEALGESVNIENYKTLKDQKWFLHLINLSTIFGFLIQPIFGILLPILLWLLKRDEIALADNYGKKIIQFQILWIIIIYFAFFIASLGNHIEYNLIFFQILYTLKNIGLNSGGYLVITSIILYLYNISFIITNNVRIQRGLKAKIYPSLSK